MTAAHLPRPSASAPASSEHLTADRAARRAPAPAGGAVPWTWAVTWGVLARPGFVVEHVVAWDSDEALALAAQRRTDLPRPRVAFVVGAR